MRFPITAHTSPPWPIHDIAPDFEVEDVWALPTPGGPGELPRLVSQSSQTTFPTAPRYWPSSKPVTSGLDGCVIALRLKR